MAAGPSSSSRTRQPSSSEEKPASRGMVIFSVLFYLVAALVMIMANKWVLNSVSVPLFFLFVQLVIAVLLLHISAVFGYFTIPSVQLSTCRGLVPLVSINVLGLIFNTYCLSYVDASFYQVARGLVLPFTVFFSYLLLSSKSSLALLAGVAIVCVGFLMGVSGEAMHRTSSLGITLGVFSSLTTSVHAIVVKKSLSVVRGSTMDLVYYNNLLSALLLSPLVFLSGEATAVVQLLEEGGRPLSTFLWGATITGVFGFLICIAGFLSIKVTSPVTHMISSAVRGVIQTFLGMWCFGDVITAGRGSGILFILLGSTLYTYVKDRESRAPSAPSNKSAPIITNRALYSLPPMQQARSYQGQSHPHMQPQGRYDDEPTASTSAHNSPVLASSASGMFSGPAARLGVLNVGLANSSARDGAVNGNGSGAGSGLPSPRTPRQQVGAQQQAHFGPGHGTYAVETPGSGARAGAQASEPGAGAGPGPTGVRLSPGNQTPSRRLSYDGRRTDSGFSHGLHSPHQSPQKASAIAMGGSLQHAQAGHGKSTSLSDLRDLKEILTGQSHYPRGVGKEEKAF